MTQTIATAPLSASDISGLLDVNLFLVTKHTDGLSHQDSLLQPAPRGNCFNWVLGHIALYREYMLQDLGLTPEVGEVALARYAKDSEPIVGDGDGVRQVDDLIAIIGRQQERMLASLASMSDSELARTSSRNDSKTVAGNVLFFAWHEGYHLGQTEVLRELGRTDDKLT